MTEDPRSRGCRAEGNGIKVDKQITASRVDESRGEANVMRPDLKREDRSTYNYQVHGSFTGRVRCNGNRINERKQPDARNCSRAEGKSCRRRLFAVKMPI